MARDRLFSLKVQTSRGARLLFYGYRRFFPRGESGRGRDTDPSLHLVPCSGISGTIRLPPFRLPSLHAQGLYNYLCIFFVKAETDPQSIMLLLSRVPNCDTRGLGVPCSLHVTSNAAHIDLTSTRPFTLIICSLKCRMIHSALLLQEACHVTCNLSWQSPNTFAAARHSKYCADKLLLHSHASLPVLTLTSASNLFTIHNDAVNIVR